MGAIIAFARNDEKGKLVAIVTQAQMVLYFTLPLREGRNLLERSGRRFREGAHSTASE
jgi:hypothetical protein